MPSPARPHSINKRKKKKKPTQTVPEAFVKLSASWGWRYAHRLVPRCSPSPRHCAHRQHPPEGARGEAEGCSGPGRFSRPPRKWEGFLASHGQIWGQDPLRNVNISVFPMRKKKTVRGQSLRGSLRTTSSPSPQLHPLTKEHRRDLTVKGEITELPRVTFLAAKCC